MNVKCVPHPGHELQQLLDERRILQKDLAERIGVGRTHLNMICQCKRSISIEIGLKLSFIFFNEPGYWARKQFEYDLYNESLKIKL